MPGFNFINDDIDKIEPEALMKEAGIIPGQVDMLIGGPPC
jgi:site-specific DNA-cytosine methylase